MPSQFPVFSTAGTIIGGLWTTDRRLDNDHSASMVAAKLNGSMKLPNGLSAKVEGMIEHERSQSQSNRLPQIREGYFQKKSDNGEFRLGRQLVAWGRADKLNPTDYFTVRNYTLLTSDEEDQKRGVDALRVITHLGNYDLQVVAAAGNAANHWPFNLPGNTVSYQSKRQVGIKLDRYGQGVDWSLSAYRGMDRNPNFLPNPLTGAVVSNHEDVSALGGDFAAAKRGLTLRGEAAYFQTATAWNMNPYHRRNHLDVVLGVDGNPFRDANLGVQYYAVLVNSYSGTVLNDPIAQANALLGNQLHRFQQGATIRFAKSWMNDLLQFELRSAIGFTDGGKYLSPRLAYKPADNWTWTLGGESYIGNSSSYYGQFSKNSGVFVEGKLSW